ncbi:hypothetical protein GGR52DRAFT_538604 [Hypoxylon sp. FL1284]|nr:hypothetical protein GGR52DRAFT_538604 [Hypoxylon sp. FL1284]
MANTDVDFDVDFPPRAPFPTAADYTRLVLPTSRWINLPQNVGQETGATQEAGFDALIYIKDAGAISPDNLASVVGDLFKGATYTSSVYREGQGGQVVRQALAVNEGAHNIMMEMNELIQLGRTAYSDPMVLGDWLRAMFEERFRLDLLQDDNGRAATLRRVLDWGEKWVEVRYRFLHHFLRDDPRHWERMEEEYYQTSGNSANNIIHQSSVEEDCLIAGSTWFDTDSRAMYKHVYGFTVRHGVRLRSLRYWTKIPTTMRNVFRWAVMYINRVIGWREGRLRIQVRNLIASRPKRGETGHARNDSMRRGMDALERELGPFITAYSLFINSLLTLLDDAVVRRKFVRRAWNNFMQAARRLREFIRRSRLNLGPNNNRQPRWAETFPRDEETVREFPNEPYAPEPSYFING